MIKYSGHSEIVLSINGNLHELLLKPNEVLLNVLREKVGYTGAKGGCENGDCGACTVIINSKPMKSCMVLAVECVGKEILTIEGLDNTDIQNAFIEFNGFQCGFCTSGFLMNAYAMLETELEIDDENKRIWLDSNLCRCTGYEGIALAVDKVQMKLLKKKNIKD